MDFVLRSVALNLAYSVAKSLATKRDKQKRPTTHERGTLAGKIKNPTATSATSANREAKQQCQCVFVRGSLRKAK